MTALRLLLACALLWATATRAEVAVPPLEARVTDLTGTLAASERATLEQRLQTFEAQKGSQLVVLIVPSTVPETIEQYALRVAEAWRIGRAKVDDGALLVVAKDDRTLRIEVGYGLEGVLTDATARRIISDTIVPRFRQGEFYAGISEGLERMMQVVSGESLPPPTARPAMDAPDLGRHLPLLFVLTLVMGGVLRVALGRLPGALLTGGLVTVVAWFLLGALTIALLAGALAAFFTLTGGTGFGGGPGFGGLGGRGGFGGRGGGFSGGGGGFGGGGASGRW